MLIRLGVLIYIMVLITSCGRNPKRVDVAAISLEVKTGRLDQDLFLTNGVNIFSLKNKYGSFFDLFCYKLTNVGTPDTVLLQNRLLDFTSDPDLKEIYLASEASFHNFNALDQPLPDASW